MSVALSEIRVDVGAIEHNVRVLRKHVDTEHFMAVVKANAYGHGAFEAAKASIRGGATWLGVAHLGEGLLLREQGITAPILSWLHAVDADFFEAIEVDIDIGVSTFLHLETVVRAAEQMKKTARIHLKIDTGLSRNGFEQALWRSACLRAHEAERAGLVQVRGVFSHLAYKDSQSDRIACAKFSQAIEVASEVGLKPSLKHIGASTQAITEPWAWFNMVRVGLAQYGISPPGVKNDLGLRPAMSLRSQVVNVREVEAGAGVSYGYTHVTSAPTRLVLVPVGYADGLPYQATNRAYVTIAEKRYPAVGRIAMDQIVVDVGNDDIDMGTEVVLFGDPNQGYVSVEEWATWSEAISYEVMTRMGTRSQRTYVHSGEVV